MMDFSTYCKTKKIDPELFKMKESGLYESLEKVFNQLHPDSFTQQKLFLINPLRLKYTYDGPLPEVKKLEKTNVPKPIIKPSANPVKKPSIQPKMSGLKPKVVIKPGGIKPSKKD